MKVECAVITDIGLVRGTNEDNYYVNGRFKSDNFIAAEGYVDNRVRDSYLYAVCDGTGGGKNGELASMIAVESLAEFQYTDLRYTIIEYIEKANKYICGEVGRNRATRSGSTLALLFMYKKKAIAYNIGDSRVYLLRGENLYLMTEDHTEAQRMLNMGFISDEAVQSHKTRNQLTQYLGIFPDELILEPYVSEEVKVKKNDVFLVCSDGLTDMVGHNEIADILALKNASTVSIAKELAAAAQAYGGKDNTTAIVIRIL